MSVATIGIRELRDGLSKHVAAVRDGGEIIVTDHGAPVARLVPYAKESGLERLVREGLVTLPTGPRRPLADPVPFDGTVSDVLSESRSRY